MPFQTQLAIDRKQLEADGACTIVAKLNGVAPYNTTWHTGDTSILSFSFCLLWSDAWDAIPIYLRGLYKFCKSKANAGVDYGAIHSVAERTTAWSACISLFRQPVSAALFSLSSCHLSFLLCSCFVPSSSLSLSLSFITFALVSVH